MKKLWSMLAILAALFIVSCSDDYDDTAIKNQINDLENRVTSLEQLCQQMNTNISSMQTILNALQQRDYITSVTPIKEGDAVIGYTINFAINDPITIYHGKNGAAGKDGYVPSIGVAKFEDDGLYYWTLDGEWLTDAEGNKVRAQGLDGGAGNGGSEGSAGKDGITPQLKIKLNFWYISYDNGATWERLGPATGVDGADGRPGQDGDSFFKSVEVKDGYVVIVLNDEEQTTISIPTKETFEELEERVAALEETAEGLQKLVDAINNSLVIKSYKPFNDKTGSGYEITFAKADGTEVETIKIYNGVTPIIGVKWVNANEVKDNEAAYYWTVNGELVKDADGNLIPATGPQGPQGEQGSNGKDGQTITPEFKIEKGNLYVSFGDTNDDGEKDWTDLGTVQGEQGPEGPAGKDGTKITVTEEDDGTITIVVGEGEDAIEFEIPKYIAMSVSISVAEGDTDVAEPGTTKTLNVTFTGEPTIKTVISNWPAKITNWDNTTKTAKVNVTIPKSTTAGDSEAVTILVSDGYHTAMNTITLTVTKKTTYKVGDIYEVTIKDGSKKKAVVISINNPSEDGYGTSGKVMAIEEWTGLKYYGNGSDNQAKSAFAHYGTDWTMPLKSDWNNSISANFQTIQAAIEANDGDKLNTTNGVKYWAEEKDQYGQGSLGQLSTAGTISWSTASTHTGCVRAVLAVSEF